MKIKNAKLAYYVFNYDFNKKEVYRFNILDSEDLKERIVKGIKKGEIKDIPSLKESLKRYFMYRYWSKAEYEILVTDLFPKDFEKESVKLDVWFQIEPNLDRIVEHIVNEMQIEFNS